MEPIRTEREKKGKKYKFTGKFIKITQKEYDCLKVAYPWVDLAAELQALDDYYSEVGVTVGKWFARCSVVRDQELGHALDDIRAYLGIEKPAFVRPVKREYVRPEKPKVVKPRDLVRDYLCENQNLPKTVLDRYKLGDKDGAICFPFATWTCWNWFCSACVSGQLFSLLVSHS